MDGRGRKVIEIPPAPGTTETALKAMVFLWERQRECTCLFPNNEPSPRDDGLIRKAYRQYRERVVVDQQFEGSTRQGNFVVLYISICIIVKLTWRSVIIIVTANVQPVFDHAYKKAS